MHHKPGNPPHGIMSTVSILPHENFENHPAHSFTRGAEFLVQRVYANESQ